MKCSEKTLLKHLSVAGEHASVAALLEAILSLLLSVPVHSSVETGESARVQMV